MSKNSKDTHGAHGTTSLLSFDPADLKIITDKDHPLFDERAFEQPTEEYILNVMAHGVIQPIAIRKNPETGEKEVVYGRKRTRALIEANRRSVAAGEPIKFIQAKIVRGTPQQLAAMVIIENEIRTDDTPLNRANKAQRLMDQYGMAEDQVSVVFGCTTNTVKAMLALLGCTAAVRNAVDSGKVNVSLALKLAKLEPEEQRTKLAEVIEAGAGATGHAKSKKMREAAGVGPKPRGKKDLELMLKRVVKGGDAHKALKWALGGKDDSFATETE